LYATQREIAPFLSDFFRPLQSSSKRWPKLAINGCFGASPTLI
jgi:hypothetical protein